MALSCDAADTLAGLTEKQIETWIGNHEKKGATDTEFFRLLLEERARRQSSGLKTEVSLRHLMEMARAEKFTTYGDLARANCVAWNIARYAMNGPRGHLDRILDVCHARGLPLLTSLCVNKGGIEEGELSEDALKGFSMGARRLGYVVVDEQAFLRRCQDECFQWGRQSANASVR
jgi:hypothetical protein